MNFPMHKHGGDVDGIGGGGGGSFRAAKFKRNLATKVCRWFACLIEIDIYLDSYSGRTHWALRWLMFNLSINMCLILSWSTSTQWPNGRPMVWVKMSQQHGQWGGSSIYLSIQTNYPSIHLSIHWIDPLVLLFIENVGRHTTAHRNHRRHDCVLTPRARHRFRARQHLNLSCITSETTHPKRLLNGQLPSYRNDTE